MSLSRFPASLLLALATAFPAVTAHAPTSVAR